MASNVMSTHKIAGIVTDLRPNKVLNLISITLLTLMIIFAWKLIIHLFYADISPINNEITTILSSCLAVNIVAYLILNRYQLLLTILADRVKVGKASLNHAVDNLRHEITVRKCFEAELRRRDEKYRLLETQIPAMIFKGYVDWTVDFFDDRIETITGYKKEDFDSRKIKWSDVIPGEEDLHELKRIFLEALNGNRKYVREYRIKDIEGKVVWIEERAEIFCDKDGRINHISGVFFDITKRRQA